MYVYIPSHYYAVALPRYRVHHMSTISPAYIHTYIYTHMYVYTPAHYYAAEPPHYRVHKLTVSAGGYVSAHSPPQDCFVAPLAIHLRWF